MASGRVQVVLAPVLVLALAASCGPPDDAAWLDQQAAAPMTPLPTIPLIPPRDAARAPSADGSTTSSSPPRGWSPSRAAPIYAIHSGWLLGTDGRRLLSLEPELWVAHLPAADARHPVRARAVRLRFGRLQVRSSTSDGWVLSGSVDHGLARYELTLAGTAGDPRIQLELRSRYGGEVLVSIEVLSLETAALPPYAGHVTMLDRAYREVFVRRPSFAGPLSPHQVSVARISRPAGSTQRASVGGAGPWTRATVVGGAGIQGLRVIPRPDGRFIINLELDHHGNHPFAVMTRCRARGRGAVRGRGAARGRGSAPRRPLSEGRRCRDSVSVARASVVLGGATLPRVMRYPRGHRAALVFSDHADQSSAAKLEAFAFGRTGALQRLSLPRGGAHPGDTGDSGDTGARGADEAGFVNRGLAYTKTIFAQRDGPHAPQLEDSRYRAVLDAMARRGVEVGLHSPTGRADPPERVKRLLASFRVSYGGKTWIDHQPDTNCEAVSCQGWDPAGKWYILPQLRAAGFRYLWAARDLPLPDHGLNLLLPDRPSLRRPVAFHHSRLEPCGATDFVLFNTAMFFDDRARVLERFSAENLDRLEAEHGLLIAHTYLDTYRQRGRFARRVLLEAAGPGQYALRPEIDALFARLGRRQRRETLWVASVERVLGHMLGALRAEIDYAPDGAALLRAPEAVAGLTLRIPAPPGVTALVDGRPPAGLRRYEQPAWRAAPAERGVELWFDAHVGQVHRLELREANGAPLPLLRGALVELR